MDEEMVRHCVTNIVRGEHDLEKPTKIRVKLYLDEEP
jgi:hypothetical protein